MFGKKNQKRKTVIGLYLHSTFLARGPQIALHYIHSPIHANIHTLTEMRLPDTGATKSSDNQQHARQVKCLAEAQTTKMDILGIQTGNPAITGRSSTFF